MAVYVDEVTDHTGSDKPVTRRYGTRWSHLMADSREELDAMALKIGLRAAYRQHTGKPTEHYDLTPSVRLKAIAAGATPLTHEQFREYLRQKIGQLRLSEGGL